MKLQKISIQDVLSFLRIAKLKVLSFLRDISSTLLHYTNKRKDTIFKIVLPLLIIGLSYYACSSSQSTISKNIDEIFSISDNIRAYYADKPDYWGVSTQSLIDNKVIPSKFIKENKVILYGNMEILVGYGEKADVVMPLAQYFDIVMPNLNKAQCMSYAESPLLPEISLTVYSIRIINRLGDYLFEWGGMRSLPIAKYATKDLCIDGQNTIIWSIR